tara:strand:+ start:1359 stop:1589 length:231 start_codon:yes stop_codon:yes gene_type:complete
VASFTSSSGNIISIPDAINTVAELENVTILLADFMALEDDNIHNGIIVEKIASLISEYEETLPDIIEFNKNIFSKN